MKNRSHIFLFLLSLTFLFQGCFIIPYLFESPITGDWNNPPPSPTIHLNRLGNKKIKKKLLLPPIPFMAGMRKYRIEKNSFPLTMEEFRSHSLSTRNAMNSLKEAGYTDFKIKYWSLDSFRLAWEHPHIENQPTNRKNLNVDASGVFIFTYQDSSFATKGVFK